MQNSFDIVIATRNRPEALSISIPYLLSNQNRLPEKLIIIDASDDHDSVRRTLDSIKINYKHTTVEVVLIHSNVASSSYQRNVGLALASADVVIFPDDDSIFFPHAIDAMMKIYDLDVETKIAGVCAAESISPPPDFPSDNIYKEKMSISILKKIGKYRYKAEHAFCPDPFILFGRRMKSRYKPLDFFPRDNVVQVEYMTGFRMSFRRDVIKKYRFCEVFRGYCLYEDTDASFSAYQEGMLVGARNAKIYHHTFPARRSSGFNMGLLPILNRAYVIAKHAPDDKKLLFQLKKYSLYKLIQYLVGGLKSQYGRARLNGALFGFKHMGSLATTQALNRLAKEYASIINQADVHQQKNHK